MRAESISVGGVESFDVTDADDGVRRGRLAGGGLSCVNDDDDGDESFGVDLKRDLDMAACSAY